MFNNRVRSRGRMWTASAAILATHRHGGQRNQAVSAGHQERHPLVGHTKETKLTERHFKARGRELGVVVANHLLDLDHPSGNAPQ